jgi:nicotinamide-nucleotide amidase
MKAAIISIGDEILIGQITNTNAAWIGSQLSQRGVEIVASIVIKDEVETILKALKDICNIADLVLITGGLGPTKDDVTKLAINKFLDCDSVFSEVTFQKISQYFQTRKKELSDLHRLQCYMPAMATLLNNNLGTAPGMMFIKDNCTFISMPGVPYEMKDIMTNEVLAKFINSGESIVHKTIMLAGIGETDVADKIENIENSLPEYIKLAYLPSLGYIRLRLSAKGKSETDLNTELDVFIKALESKLSKYVYGFDDITLEEKVAELCKKKGKKIATAESCTGGLIAKNITDLSGSSEYFLGSIIAYSNTVKREILNVASDTLDNHGAVSAETAKEMVLGANSILKSDIAVAVTGVAGPGGGTIEKPVGTIWIAVGNEDKVVVKLLKGMNDRDKNRIYASNIAMNELRKFLEDI